MAIRYDSLIDMDRRFRTSRISLLQCLKVTMITRVMEDHSLARPSRSALATTETELKLIAALAIIGLRSNPKKG